MPRSKVPLYAAAIMFVLALFSGHEFDRGFVDGAMVVFCALNIAGKVRW